MSGGTVDFHGDVRQHQSLRLRAVVAAVAESNPFWRAQFASAGVDASSIQSIEDLCRLPLLTKAELVADQAAHPPYGSNLTRPVAAYQRLHQTSGTSTGTPLRWLDTAESWRWMLSCWTQIYQLVGLRPTDRLCFPFSFGPFLGFWAGFEGALAQGNLCIAAGGMSSDARLAMLQANRITWIGCTPTYALRLAEVAGERGVDPSSLGVRAILVAGEAGGSVPEIRSRMETAWNARVFDHWGMTEVGPLAIEPVEAPGTLSLLESECIPEILDPQTGSPTRDGEIGELVITNLGRVDSPVIRYRTGDLVRAGRRDGRGWMSLPGGVLGRADDMLVIRGNNVFPSSLEAIVRRFPDAVEFRLRVGRVREMTQLTIEIEPTPAAVADWAVLERRIAQAVKDELQFVPIVTMAPVGSLPRFEMKASRLIRE